MALNKNSNLYTIIYTVVMVVIVGVLLAAAATILKPMQDANALLEKKTAIMKAFGNESGDFDKLVTMGTINIDEDGYAEFVTIDKENKGAVDAVFELLANRKALAEATNDLPIFKYEEEGKAPLYVLPLVGKGLWGDIWGYIALERVADNVKIAGIVMDHAGETPGLGAEIATDGVQGKFADKLLYNGAGEFAVRMQKGGARDLNHEVDAITGGTKTCDGVNAMLSETIAKYEAFFKAAPAVEAPVVEEVEAPVVEEVEAPVTDVEFDI